MTYSSTSQEKDKLCVSCHEWIGLERLRATNHSSALCIKCAKAVSSLHNQPNRVQTPLQSLNQPMLWDVRPTLKKLEQTNGTNGEEVRVKKPMLISQTNDRWMMPVHYFADRKPKSLQTRIGDDDMWERLT